MNYNEIESIIAGKEKIFISSHINPDGDSLGSASAMYHYLKKMGKEFINIFRGVYTWINIIILSIFFQLFLEKVLAIVLSIIKLIVKNK